LEWQGHQAVGGKGVVFPVAAQLKAGPMPKLRRARLAAEEKQFAKQPGNWLLGK